MHLSNHNQRRQAAQRASLIRAAQTKLLYAAVPLSVIATLFNATILAIVQWPVIEHLVVMGWLGTVVLITVLRGGLAFAFKRAAPAPADIEPWAGRFFVGTLFAGLAWGAAGVLLFPPGDVAHQVFLAFVLAGMAAGAVTALSSMWQVIAGFLILCLAPLALRIFITGETMALAMGAMTVLFLIVVVASGRRMSNHILENIALRVEGAQREETQRRGEELLRQTGQMANVGGWELDLASMTLRWSDEMYRIHQLPHGGQPTLEQALEFYPPDARPVIEQAVKKTMTDGTPYELELPLITAQGNRRWVRALGQGHIERGRVVRLAGALQDITERKQDERSLNRFKYVLDNTLDMIFMFEPDTLRFVYLNEGAITSMGYAREELLQMTPYQIKPLIPESEFHRLIAPLLSGEKPSLNFETLHQRKDGGAFPVEIFLQLVREPNDKGLFVAIVRDITERKQAEQELQQQHSLLDIISRTQSRFIRDADSRTLFDELLGDILSLTESEYGFIGEVLYTEHGQPYLKTNAITDIAWDQATREFYDENAAQGMEFYNLETLFGAALTSGKPVIANQPETDPRRGGLPDGHPRLNAFLGVPFYLGEKMVGMAGVANRPGGYNDDLLKSLQPLLSTCAHIIEALRNDLQRKQAEAALRESAARIRAIVDNVVDGIITIDERGLVESLNPAAERIFGYQAGEVIGHNVKMLMPEPYCSEHDGYLDNYRSTGVARIIGIGREVEGRRKDGSVFPLELAVSEMQLGDRRAYTGVVRDITERKKIERMKNEFVSTVSHELRTPLTSIRGSLGLIGGGAAGELPERAKGLIDIAHKNSERLIVLINDILDMEKIASGKMKFDFRVRPLMPLVEQALEANLGYGEQFGVRLQLTTTVEQAQVSVDAERLLQVLSNLLSNAAKFSSPGGQVEVAVTRRAGQVRIAVSDHGPGIPEDFRDRIFQEFSQADSSDTRQKGGTGLGLSISKSIIERMDGSISFETQIGTGTSFYVDLPERCDQDSTGDNEQTASAKSAAVLICEDDRDIAVLLGMMLRHGGFDTDFAYDAAQAKAMLQNRQYAAMTLDLGLPGQDGISLIRELRSAAATQDLPIVVVSAKVEQGRVAVNGDFSAIDWLAKPIDEARLVEAVRRTLHKIEGNKPRILHVEDDADIRHIVSAIGEEVAEFDFARSLQEARDKLALTHYNLVVLDLSLPDGSGWELLPMLKRLRPQPPVLVLSASDIVAEDAGRVEAALVKSQTSNKDLLDTISAVVGRGAQL